MIDLEILRQMLKTSDIMIPYYEKELAKRTTENAAMIAAGLPLIHSEGSVKFSADNLAERRQQSVCLKAVIEHFEHEEKMKTDRNYQMMVAQSNAGTYP